MDGHPAADEWLMADAARGCRESMNALVCRYAGPLLTFIQRMIGDRHRAEELLQEVFLATWVQRRKYLAGRPFRAWLFGIAANKCRAAFRRPALATVDCGDDSPGAAVAGGPTPVEAAIAAETAAVVGAAVAELPPGQRTILVLRVYNGLAYEEIARIVGRTEATVRSQMCHALRAVRRRLERRLR
jgi:RNA polymerase sigma-70 factor (ECF subfamily)